MPTTRRRCIGMTMLCLGAALVVTRPVPSHAAAAQAVSAPTGLVAHGYVPDAAIGGERRWVSVILVDPVGPVVSSGAADGVDLAAPWAVLSVVSVDTARPVCGRVENTTAFDRGRAVPTGTGAEAWRGTALDVACDDGSGYLFYRVQWDAGASWLVRNPLPLEHSGGHVTRWSAPPHHGVIETVPTAMQQTRVTICGYRDAAGRPGPADCFGSSSGFGAVVPTTHGLHAQAAAVPGA